MLKKPRGKKRPPTRVVIKPRVIRSERLDPTKSKNLQDVDPKDANIGPFFFEEDLYNQLPRALQKKWQSRLEKWDKMANHDRSANYVDPKQLERSLEEFLEENPKVFIRRVCKGPPPYYRWMAWKVISFSRRSQIAGVFQELVAREERDNPHFYTLSKDLNRTLPTHPFFDKAMYILLIHHTSYI